MMYWIIAMVVCTFSIWELVIKDDMELIARDGNDDGLTDIGEVGDTAVVLAACLFISLVWPITVTLSTTVTLRRIFWARKDGKENAGKK